MVILCFFVFICWLIILREFDSMFWIFSFLNLSLILFCVICDIFIKLLISFDMYFVWWLIIVVIFLCVLLLLIVFKIFVLDIIGLSGFCNLWVNVVRNLFL